MGGMGLVSALGAHDLPRHGAAGLPGRARVDGLGDQGGVVVGDSGPTRDGGLDREGIGVPDDDEVPGDRCGHVGGHGLVPVQVGEEAAAAEGGVVRDDEGVAVLGAAARDVAAQLPDHGMVGFQHEVMVAKARQGRGWILDNGIKGLAVGHAKAGVDWSGGDVHGSRGAGGAGGVKVAVGVGEDRIKVDVTLADPGIGTGFKGRIGVVKDGGALKPWRG